MFLRLVLFEKFFRINCLCYLEVKLKYLKGLREYLDENYEKSVFKDISKTKEMYEFHIYDHKIIKGYVRENLIYDVKLEIEEEEQIIPKIEIKYINHIKYSDDVKSLIKIDQKVKNMNNEPIISPAKRYYIKNKSLFPLMKEKEVLYFTLLEGDIIRGLVTGFNQYEINVSMKKGIPVIILRHSIYDVRNKKNRSFLKSFQQKHKDWKKSPLFVDKS